MGVRNFLEGRLEIYHSGRWGTVCGDYFSSADARVVCRQLGLEVETSVAIVNPYGDGSGYIWMDDVRCVGTESSLSECEHAGWAVHNCDHRQDAAVTCIEGNSSSSILCNTKT